MALLAACATPPPLTVGGSSTPAHQPAAERPVFCHLQVHELEDRRSDPRMLGNVGNRAVYAPTDSRSWLQNTLRGLARYGVALQFGDGTAAGALPVRISLLQAWLSSQETSKIANVVLELSYQQAGSLYTARYRGSEHALNWSSSDDEINNLLDEAFAQAFRQMASDLQHSCPAPAS